jgi:lipopolysaccharide export system protein LptC
MESPVYEGADAKGQQYRITGTKATQVSEDLIVIDNVDGQLVHGNAFTSLRAQRAEYAQKQHYIDLVGDVQVMSGEGYHFTTPRARVDTGSMIVTGDEQVTGEGPMGNLLATGFEIRDNGKTVRFGRTGRVNVEIIRTENPS